MVERIKNLAIGIVGIAMATSIVMPRRSSSAQVLQAMGSGFAGSINAAISANVVAKDTRTPAEKFHDEAIEAISDFWAGRYEWD